MDRVQKYLEDVGGLLASAPMEDIRRVGGLLMDAYENGKQVFVLGNGGSAATASHLACDLQKTIGLCGDRKFKVMSLTDNVSIMTAWANDFDYSDIFAQQLATWVDPGDLVIGISGSGNSPNVLKAVELARKKGAVTVGMAGFTGGKLAGMVDHSIVIQSENMQHIEDVHMVLCHLLFRNMLEELGG
ncbi:MAG: D-sedoheptulose-7-phosphate isomerase [Armatimonadota bacterium]